MGEVKLERLMLSFLEGDYDILVCTTIIENGMDISNTNTIIIDQADRMGLAQLYQLRGRVGRSNKVAYSYLLYKQDKVLSEIAEKRLKAIKEFTNLGSGFKIAMRDMEIRGAGNILGPEQHGHIEAIGFSLYCKLLEQAIKDLKGDKKEVKEEINIDLEVNAYIVEDYIPDSKQKIEIYKKISSIMDLEDVQDIKEELKDRFGPIPKPVLNLIKIGKVKVLALNLNVKEIETEENLVFIKFSDSDYLSGEQIIELSSRYKNQIRFKSSQEPILKLKVIQSMEETLNILTEILNFLSASKNSE
jgi:transcription-repair coupling factor (superfamily II helicase)